MRGARSIGRGASTVRAVHATRLATVSSSVIRTCFSPVLGARGAASLGAEPLCPEPPPAFVSPVDSDELEVAQAAARNTTAERSRLRSDPMDSQTTMRAHPSTLPRVYGRPREA